MTQITLPHSLRAVSRHVVAWVRDDSGQDLIEYALLSATIALVGVAAFQLMGTNMNTVYTGWDTAVQSLWETPDPIQP